MSEDLEQVVKAQAGDQEALNYLISKWHPRLANTFRSKGLHADADDLAQETLMSMINKLGQLKDPSKFTGWMNTIAANNASTAFRKQKNTMSLEPDMGDTMASGVRSGRTGSQMMSADHEDKTIDTLVNKEDQNTVRAALEELPNSYSKIEYGEEVRDVLVDFFFNGKKIREIAKERKRPEGTVKRMIHIAKEKLMDLLPSE
ncbi:MAG: RNA polymerase sigma factor [Candidatus Thorarchaeota archaeon]